MKLGGPEYVFGNNMGWSIDIVRGDIEIEVALLLIHLDLPQHGRLYQRFNVFYYLKKHPFPRIVMNPYYMDARNKLSNQFNENTEWFEFYGDAKEEIKSDKTLAYRKPVQITSYIDANYASENLTRSIHTGIRIFVNYTPILWHSKHQATIEPSTFGSEVVAPRTDL